jgi:L-xylulokinase
MVNAPSFLLGLDAGNTVIKAVLFDLTGTQIAAHGIDGATHKPAVGMVERSVPELLENARTAIRQCLEKAGIEARQIVAIGTAGHGNGLYLLDKDQQPLLGIQSLDSRAAQMANTLDRERGEALHTICLQRPWPSQTPMLLSWVKENQPELYARAGTLLFAKDVLTWHLTGRIATEISDMSGAGLVRMPEASYDDELMTLYGLGDAMELLPPLHQPSEVVGTITEEAAALTGLAAGTPVVAGLFDVVASAMGSGAALPGSASLVAGSWSINQVFSEKPVRDERVFMVAAYGPGRYANMENSATSAANLEWYVRALIERGAHHDDPFGAVNEMVGKVQAAHDDPMFQPFLYGGRLGSHYRASFFGMAGWHGEGHLLRALFEGVMFEHRRHVGVLADAGVGMGKAVLSGGGARSPHWPQIFADGLGVPVTVAEARETGALGAAMMAAVGIGIYKDEIQAAEAMTRAVKTYEPDPSMRNHYDRRYALWTRLNVASEPIWRDLGSAGRSDAA